MNKDINFLLQASVVSQRSTCARRKVGCVIVNKEGHIMSTGFNGVPRNRSHCIDNPCIAAGAPSGTDLEGCLAIHAEQNALMQCPDIMAIDVIYITDSPCMHCAKMIANTGASRVVFSKEYSHGGAIAFLNECGFELELISEDTVIDEVNRAAI